MKIYIGFFATRKTRTHFSPPRDAAAAAAAAEGDESAGSETLFSRLGC